MTTFPDLPSRGMRMGLVAAFLLTALLVYGSSLWNGFVHWDDGQLIYQNPAVMETSVASVRRAFSTYDPELYIPLTLLSYQADYLIGDGSPFMFHLQSLLWHALNALLVCWLAYALFKHRVVAVVIGLLFLVHPLHTEAVAWASGRKDVLSTFFFLASVLTFLYGRDRESKTLYWMSIGLFLLGLLSKVMVLTLPLVLLILLYRQHGKIVRRDVYEMIPFFVLSVVFGIVALFGKTDVNAASSLLEKMLMAAKSTVFYIQKLFLPLDLSVVYPYPSVVSVTSPDFIVPLVILFVLAAIVVSSLKYTRDIAAWSALYLLTLTPTFINIAKGEGDLYSASDRYAYIPSIGILFLVALLMMHVLSWAKGVRMQRSYERMVSSVSGVALVICAIIAARQSLIWKNTLTLFEHAQAHAPADSYVVHNNLGNAYAQQKDYDKAIAQFQRSLELKQHARTYANLGATYRRMGNYDLAEDAYVRAIALDEKSALSFFGLGMVHAARGAQEKALTAYAHALELDPQMAAVHINIGALHAKNGNAAESLAAYDRAIAIDPFSADAYYNKAVMLAEMGRYEEAIPAYEKAIDVQPRSIPARLNLALLYAQQGEREKAVAQFKAILRINPQNPAALSALNQLGEPGR